MDGLAIRGNRRRFFRYRRDASILTLSFFGPWCRFFLLFLATFVIPGPQVRAFLRQNGNLSVCSVWGMPTRFCDRAEKQAFYFSPKAESVLIFVEAIAAFPFSTDFRQVSRMNSTNRPISHVGDVFRVYKSHDSPYGAKHSIGSVLPSSHLSPV